MNQDSVVILLTIFVGLVAVSQVAQMIALVMLQKRAKALQQQISEFAPKAESLMASAKEALEHSKKQITEVTSKANDILDITRAQLGMVDSLMTDVTARAKVQFDRIELVLDDSLTRVNETVALLHNGVMKPLKEINGISAGVRAAIAHLLRGRRPSVAQATQDEEMFI
ncbi:MAG: hypothetical protein IT165_37740 [Bryobacterales bacterium]|nr:hypothetical protein [Bryobacterales bacterium]